MQAGERIEHRHLVEGFGAGLLFLDFRTEALDPELLPQGVNREEQYQSHQPAHRQIQIQPW